MPGRVTGTEVILSFPEAVVQERALPERKVMYAILALSKGNSNLKDPQQALGTIVSV